MTPRGLLQGVRWRCLHPGCPGEGAVIPRGTRSRRHARNHLKRTGHTAAEILRVYDNHEYRLDTETNQ